jgi:aspartyl aminopeptidase
MEKMLALELLEFIDNSPTAYHASDRVKGILEGEGYLELKESEKWEIQKGGKYYVNKNRSAIIAFEIGIGELETDGFRIIGAHTDSPGFRIKPKAEIIEIDQYIKLNTEVYGGPILNTWFDRPLSLAGRVVIKGSTLLKPEIKLINIDKPILVIPNLAIHMNRNVNEGYPINKQKDTLPILGLVNKKLEENDYLLNLVSEKIGVPKEEILDFDLFLYEYSKGCLIGIEEELISASRLDDLWMVFAGVKALIDSKESKATNVMICIDNEEIGSLTAQGADSSFALNILERISLALAKDKEEFYRGLSNSLMISADLAHGVHPNYIEKHDPTNKPLLGNGPVIKIAASGSYSTDAYSSGIFKGLCEDASIPYQTFVNRSDLRGGTTIGPILSSKFSIPVIDMGAALLGMHSIRELASVSDNYNTINLFKAFMKG